MRSFSLMKLFKSIFLSVVFVLIIFTPNITFLPYYTWILAFGGILCLLDSSYRKLIKFNKKSNKIFLITLFISTIYNGIIVPFVHFSGDLTYIPLLIGIILTFFRNILLVFILHKFANVDNIFKEYTKYFFIACSIYVAFTLYFIINPGFKDFWFNSVIIPPQEHSFLAYQFRYSLDGFAAFASATVFSFACLFCSFIIASEQDFSYFNIVCLLLFVIGCFFYGRVSLIGMLLGATMILSNKEQKGKTLKIVFIVVVIILLLLVYLNTLSKINDDIAIWTDWAFAFVRQLFIEKEVTDHSVTHMFEDMYFMPELTTLIWGDGKYTNPDHSYYMHTDVGFMRLILYGGLLGLILTYKTIFCLCENIKRNTNSIYFRRFVNLTLVLFVVLEMKGESYQRFIMQLYPIFLIINYQNSLNENCCKRK